MTSLARIQASADTTLHITVSHVPALPDDTLHLTIEREWSGSKNPTERQRLLQLTLTGGQMTALGEAILNGCSA